MSLDLLRMRFADTASQELLGIVSSSAQHGADMVRQVLSFARGVEGRRMEVQVRHLIREIEKIFLLPLVRGDIVRHF
jgi:signal transduction histidine kinase